MIHRILENGLVLLTGAIVSEYIALGEAFQTISLSLELVIQTPQNVDAETLGLHQI